MEEQESEASTVVKREETYLEHSGLGRHQYTHYGVALRALDARREGVKLRHPLLPVLQLDPRASTVSLSAHLLGLGEDLERQMRWK